MGILNDQVRMGASLADHRPVRNIGRIYRIGDDPKPKPIVTIVEGIGLIGGLLTLISAIFLKGVPRAVILATGGLATGVAGTSVIVRAVSKPAALTINTGDTELIPFERE